MIHHKMKKAICILILANLVNGCNTKKTSLSYESDMLKIERITEHTYRHISYLQTEDFGNVACNGMIVMDGNEVIVLDTPVDDIVSAELINWLEGQNLKIKAVVPTHFHDDCLGGLNVFHEKNIPSYALDKTIKLAIKANVSVPKNEFAATMELGVGNKKLLLDHVGEGHTSDNIIGYFPSEKVMFGGCLIKSVGAGKGFLGDANITEWPKTVSRIKSKYAEVATVVPGHGNPGKGELLDYTVSLFKE